MGGSFGAPGSLASAAGSVDTSADRKRSTSTVAFANFALAAFAAAPRSAASLEAVGGCGDEEEAAGEAGARGGCGWSFCPYAAARGRT